MTTLPGVPGQSPWLAAANPPPPAGLAPALVTPSSPMGEERDLVALLRARLAPRLTRFAQELEAAELPQQGLEERKATVTRLLQEELATEATSRLTDGRPPLDHQAENRVVQAVMDGLFGLGDLQQLLDDPRIENISVNGADRVFVRYADGTKARVAPLASSDEELIELIRRIGARTGTEERRFDRASPSLNLQLPDGSRLFALMAVTDRVSLSIRRHRFQRVTLADLKRMGTIDDGLALLLHSLVRARMNIVIAGGTNTGKTTLLRACISAIPANERLITIEDTFELALDRDLAGHPDIVPLQVREANIEGEGAIDQAQLVRYALRMAPERVIVGEIRGAEVIPMCNAMSQGNDGSLSTLHASTSGGVFTKLAAYAAQAPERLTLEATNLLVASAVHVVVHIGWSTDGVRVVDSVREVVGADGPHVVSNEIYRPGPDGRALPATPPRAETMSELVAAGLDPSLWNSAWWGG